MQDFSPLNDLEIALVEARSGRLLMSGFIKVFVGNDLAVPSGREVMANGDGFQPVLFDKNGVKMVACFTAKERIGRIAGRAPYCLAMKGMEFLRRVPPGYGLVINPGQSVGFDISPDGLSSIVKSFG
jgi:hypothetical protein